MKIKLDLSKFKLESKDDDYAIMSDSRGHKVHIAIKALHPENRKSLESLETSNADQEETEVLMAQGGEVKRSKGPWIDPKAAKEVETGATKSGWQPDEWKKNFKEGMTFAKGGEVRKPEAAMPPEPKGNWIERGTDPDKRKKMADSLKKAGFALGGPVPKDKKIDFEPIEKEHVDYEAIEPESHVKYEPVKMAQGGLAAVSGQLDRLSGQMPEAAMAPMPAAPQDAGLAAAQAPVDAPAEPSTMDAYAQQAQGIQGQAQAQQQQAAGEQQALGQGLSQVNNLMQQYQTHVQDLDSERKAFQQDIVDTHIDPHKYLGSMDTGAKFDTAVGLIMGGLGGGGNSNAALDFLNKQIDRDIDAQKAQLGKKETLLSANLKQFGNLQDATNMTKVMQHDIILNKLKMAEAKATNPLAKARAQQQIGALEAQVAPVVQQLATNKMLSGFEQQAKADPAKYPQVIQMLEQTDPKKAADMRERLVPGIGLANTPKDANEVKEISIAASGAKSAINELRNIMSETGKSVSPSSRAKAESIRQQLIGQMRVAILGPGTVNESERKLLENLIPDVTSITSLDSSNAIKLDALERRMADGVNQNLAARGVAGSSPQTATAAIDPKHAEYLAWAQANPNDPRAAAVLKKLGRR